MTGVLDIRSVVSLGSQAFYGTGITSLILNEGITYQSSSNRHFSSCASLADVTYVANGATVNFALA